MGVSEYSDHMALEMQDFLDIPVDESIQFLQWWFAEGKSQVFSCFF